MRDARGGRSARIGTVAGGLLAILVVPPLALTPLALGPSRALAAPAGGNSPAASAPSNSNADAPGGASSGAATASRQGQSSTPVGTPGTIAVAKGVALTATYLGEAAGNPSGGIRQGAAYSGQVFGGLDFDLKTIAGIDGGAVHFGMVERHGESDSAKFIGNDTSVQQIYGQQKLRLVFFTYQQKLFNDRVDVTVGRSGGNDEFLTSPLYCLFQSNAVCGSPVYIFQMSNFTAFPASGWAGTAKVYLTDRIFAHFGAYAADPRNTAPNEVGFNLSTSTATGATVPVELVYATDFAQDRLPRHYRIGTIIDASKRADPYLDANNQPAILSGLPYRMDFGRSVVYGSFDQMVYRPDDESPCGLSVFGLGFFTTSGRVTQDHSFELGVVQLGTLPGRDRDTIGFAVNEKRYSQLFVDNIAAARTMAGGSPDIPREQVMFELNYGYELNRAVRLTPNLQYVLNPDQSSVPGRTTNIPNAFVVGGRIVVDFSALGAL